MGAYVFCTEGFWPEGLFTDWNESWYTSSRRSSDRFGKHVSDADLIHVSVQDAMAVKQGERVLAVPIDVQEVHEPDPPPEVQFQEHRPDHQFQPDLAVHVADP